jgi:hypothetical protein
MRRLPSGMIFFDTFDIICLSISFGSTISFVVRKYKEKKSIDPIVTELKNISPIKEELPVKPVSLYSNLERFEINPTLVRGGEIIRTNALITEKGVALLVAIKDKKFYKIIQAILKARKQQQFLKLLQYILLALDHLLKSKVGLHIVASSTLNWSQFLIVFIPSTLIGVMFENFIKNPIITVLSPLALMYGRGTENILEPRDDCRTICKIAEKYHNKELNLEMKEFVSTNNRTSNLMFKNENLEYLKNKFALERRLKLNGLAEESFETFELPFNEGPLVCIEEQSSLVQPFKLEKIVGIQKSRKLKKRIQHFNEFIKQFPDCGVDEKIIDKEIYQEVVDRIRK